MEDHLKSGIATTDQIFLKCWTSAKGTKLNYKNCLKWKWPPMEDNLEILKVEYLSNQ